MFSVSATVFRHHPKHYNARYVSQVYSLSTMSTSPVWLIQHAIVDIQYDRGFSYFDRCGSLVLALEDLLGKPFRGSVPMMERGEAQNAAERLVVTYGPRNFNVTQQWVQLPVRVEQIAPMAWEKVSDVLGVSKHVTRCGVRHQFFTRTETLEEANQLLAKCRFASFADEWRELLGEGETRAASIAIEDRWGGRLRAAAEVFEITVTAPLPGDLVDIVPNFGISLDLDSTYPRGERSGKDVASNFTVEKGQLKEFIRTSWQRARNFAGAIGARIGVGHV